MLTRFTLLSIVLLGIPFAHARESAAASCPNLAGTFESATEHSPLVITQETREGITTYHYGSGGGEGEALVADGIERDGITVSCAGNQVVKHIAISGYQMDTGFTYVSDKQVEQFSSSGPAGLIPALKTLYNRK